MGFVLVVLAVIAVFSLVGISGTLRRIEHHNAKFVPETERGFRLSEGDVIVVRAFGVEQVCAVKSLVESPDGTLAATVDPVGAR